MTPLLNVRSRTVSTQIPSEVIQVLKKKNIIDSFYSDNISKKNIYLDIYFHHLCILQLFPLLVYVIIDNNRSRAGDCMAGDVPEKYYIVQNNDVIRIKYLLVYCQKSVSQRYSYRRLV